MPAVDSTAIMSIDYDPPSRVLFVRFVDGDLYAYFGVPRSTYDAFLAAESKGRFLAEQVRPPLPPPSDQVISEQEFSGVRLRS